MRGSLVALLCACGRIGFHPTGASDASDASNAPDAPDASEVLPDLCGDTTGLLPGAAWPLIHACPSNSGRSALRGPMSGAIEIPPTGTVLGGRGAAIAANGVIVIVAQFSSTQSYNAVLSYAASDGAQGWLNTDPVGFGWELFPALDAHGLAWETTDYGKAFGIDVVTGMTVHSPQFGGSFSAATIGPDGTVYMGSVSGYGVYAFDRTGAQVWHKDLPVPGDVTHVPAIADGLLYFVDTTNSELFEADTTSGAILHEYPVPGKATSSPVLGVGTDLYIATTTAVVALDRQTGQVLWQAPAMSPTLPALLARGDLVFAAGSALIVVDHTSGAQRRVIPLDAVATGAPIVDVADTVYVATTNTIDAYDPTTGASRWQSMLTGQIVLGDGYVLVLPTSQTLATIGP